MEYCIFVEPQLGMTWDQLLAFAQATERLGFHGFFRSDHYTQPDRSFSGAPALSDAWTTLAALAMATERVRLGTLVTPVTFRHPGVLAVQVANVDAMSNGRVELGLGAGWNAPEHEAYGIPFPAKRFGLLEESLAIVTGLWTTPPDETFSFEGEHYRLDRAPGGQRPVGDDVPIIIGGGGPTRTPALAAAYAREFNTGFVADDVVAERFARVADATQVAGRDPESLRLSVALTATVGATEASAKARADAQGRDPHHERANGLYGTPADVAERFAGLRALGAERVYLQVLDVTDLEQLDLLAEAVRLAG
ncbi:TIGR03560 family F420-dependent LLM class oxidoreductase [Humibacter ginsenosidimutans]|uniref:TIGR03560 family F420-dependent LLM class oxidoreductase n=1 Tax=Humibacter ginsenosidimutans TaxID=2599293 RepID=A0A5B8M8J4_9MICO|nr:TIGR03560 family F420-dependent LLM class oxidoreductase [Humibacter ginsenosidimutans]QDZ15955.1 TIGR03560 family F420-dependent LLM class oxidoreductase [Humibacter ginsenosidimutans]